MPKELTFAVTEFEKTPQTILYNQSEKKRK